MAVRVPRVAAEAVIAALLIGAGCFMLLDLSGKQASVAVGGAKFSAKLAGKFMQLATTAAAVLPTPCTGAEGTIADLPGVCNLMNGQSGCCTKDTLNSQLLPDLSNCSSRCQSYYIAFHCYFSCKQGTYRNIDGNTATLAVCRSELQTLFNACNTQTCKVLNPGTVSSGGDTDFNSFVDTNNIRTGTTAEGCADFTSAGRRCEETAAPTIRTNNGLKVFADDGNAVDDSATAVTRIANGEQGLVFEAPTSSFTPDANFGAKIRVCTYIINPRPADCTTQPPGVNPYPLYANIVVEATGNFTYTVANAFVSSQDMELIPGTGGQPTAFRACVNNIRILPFNRAPYTLTITASAVNTFGTGTSASLTSATNSLSIPVDLPANADANLVGTTFVVNGDVQVCATSEAAGSIIVGSNSFYAPLAGPFNSFQVNTINCCEQAAPAEDATSNNGFRAQCIINGVTGTGKTLSATNFNANAVSTTIRLVTLIISGIFDAKGSITLVNAEISIPVDATFQVSSATALRGGTGTVANIAGKLNVLSEFLITLGSIDVQTKSSTVVTLSANTRFVVAETSRLISDGSQYTLEARSRLVQYTQSPGGITIRSNTGAVTVGGVAPEATGIATGIVAVSGTFVSHNINNGVTNNAVTYNPVEVRISTSRGPNAPAQCTDAVAKCDNDAVPTDAEIPGEAPVTNTPSTEKKFQNLVATPTNSRATLQLCGTTNNIVTIPATGTLLVSPPAGVTRCQVTGLPTNSLDINELNVAAGGTISITGVDSSFLPIRVRNTFNVAQGAAIIVTLAAGIDTGAIPSLNLFDITGVPAGTICQLLPNVQIINQGNRVVTPTCTSTGIALTFTAVQAPPPPQFNAGLFTSSLEYCLLLRQSVASFDRSAFLQAIDNNFGPDTTRSVVAISSFTTDSGNADNLRVTFRCYDYSSVANADLRCSNIVNSAITSNSNFRNSVLAVGTCGTTAVNPTEDNDDSNHGLYGLFGLVAIPIILIALIFCLVRNSRRRADNQYMQDAATFSNVASGPQPLATAVPAVQYDVAKEVYPAVAPAISYPAY